MTKDYRKRAEEMFGTHPHCDRCDCPQEDVLNDVEKAFQQVAQEARREAFEEALSEIEIFKDVLSLHHYSRIDSRIRSRMIGPEPMENK